MSKENMPWLIKAGLWALAGYAIARLLRSSCEEAMTAYRGNEDNRIFHDRSCRFFTANSSTATFRRRDEAINAGFQPCGICKP